MVVESDFSGGADGFISKLHVSGTALIFSTYLGGTELDIAQGIAVDGVGDAYVAGYTDSTDFPTTNALDSSLSGESDAFVSKLNASSNALVFSTYLGGGEYDSGHAIAIDGAANAYVTSRTASADFAKTNPLDSSFLGEYDAFISKLDTSGNVLVFSTCLGGSQDDSGQDIAVDGAGNVYITGGTDSADFPTTNALYPIFAGAGDAFVTKIGVEMPAPTVTSISPTSMVANGMTRQLTINGSHFHIENVVQFRWSVPPNDGVWHTKMGTPTLDSSRQIRIDINPGTVDDRIYVRVCRSSSATTTADCSSGTHAVEVSTDVSDVDVEPLNVTRTPSSVEAGRPLRVEWRIRNNGLDTADNSYSQVRFTRSNAAGGWGDSSNNVGDPQATGKIDPNANIPQGTTVAAPTGPGTYYAWVIADNDDASRLSQTRTDNDFAVSSAFTVTAPTNRGWVAIAELSVPDQVTVNERVSGNIRLSEIGGGELNFDEISASIIDSNNMVIEDLFESSDVRFTPGESHSWSIDWELPTGLSPGLYSLIVRGTTDAGASVTFGLGPGVIANNPKSFEVTEVGGRDYLIHFMLGDSFSSGEGASDYAHGTNTEDNKCHRSVRRWSSFQSVLIDIFGVSIYSHFFACSGARVVNLASYGQFGGQYGEATQINQVEDVLKQGVRPDLITFSIGGNDLGFANILKWCVKDSALACYNYVPDRMIGLSLRQLLEEDWLDNTQQLVELAISRFKGLLAEYDASETPIILLGYPHLFPRNALDQNGAHLRTLIPGYAFGITPNEQEFLRQIAQQLNARMAAAASAMGAYYVPLVDDGSYGQFDGHEISGPRADWINALLLDLLNREARPESFHPNELGHVAYAEALREYMESWSFDGKRIVPSLMDAIRAPSIARDLGIIAEKASAPTLFHIGDLEVQAQGLDSCVVDGVIVADGQASATGHGFAPSSEVEVSLIDINDQTVPLATTQADGVGAINVVVSLPGGLSVTPLGEFRARGADASGGTRLLVGWSAIAESSESDTDGDGIRDLCDNCPKLSSENQRDSDRDEIGDVCDFCPFDGSNDLDEDGICGEIDNCPLVANADQTDSNNDGIGDACTDGENVDRTDFNWLVTEIYIATMGYAPDNEGLQYWLNALESVSGWTPTTVAQSFFDQPLVIQQYPAELGFGAFIEALYQNIFGREVDAEGYAYWLEELETGRVQRNQMIIALIEGGWANSDAAEDMARFGNRVLVGLAFAEEQAARGIVYSTLVSDRQAALRELGREVLEGVTADRATRDQAIARIPGLLDAL